MISDLTDAINKVNSGDAVLLDVRSPQEYSDQAANNSINIDLADIKTGSNPKAGKDAQIFVYCRSGGRAGMASQILATRGFTNVTNVGGLDSWLAAGGAAKY